jgi:transcription-repair coupling factor (superfamily II helicase)
MVEAQDSGVVFAVTATGRETEDLATALRCYLPAEAIEEFPSWETLLHKRLSLRSHALTGFDPVRPKQVERLRSDGGK